MATRPDLDWREPPRIELSPILEAALEAFYEFGFHGASVRDVARRVGMTVPSLYYHHDSKQGLLFAVLERTVLAIVERVELADAAGTTPTERLRNMVEAIVLSMTALPRASALDASEARYLDGEYGERYVATKRHIDRMVQQVIDEGARSGTFAVDDAAEAARAILGMTQVVPRWYDAQGRATPEEIAAHYAEFALRVVDAQPHRTVAGGRSAQ